MKKLLRRCLVAGVTGAFLMACSAESMDEQMNTLDATGETVSTGDYTNADLAGTWTIVSMNSDANSPVDLNLDGTSGTDILKETSCFNDLYFTFSEGGSISTQQAKLYFETETGAMECKTKIYEATYDVSGDQLSIHFLYNGSTTTEVKVISITNEDGKEYLHFSLTDLEAQGYLPDNPQTSTGAENVEQIDFVYVKQ